MVRDFPRGLPTCDHREVRHLSRLIAACVACLLVLSVTSCTPIADRDQEAAKEQGKAAGNEFLPEDKNLSDCVGLVERPGCGSDARGGWPMVLAFAVMAGGLTFIGWRIVRGLRRTAPPPPT
jgi:hypothetical protein